MYLNGPVKFVVRDDAPGTRRLYANPIPAWVHLRYADDGWDRWEDAPLLASAPPLRPRFSVTVPVDGERDRLLLLFLRGGILVDFWARRDRADQGQGRYTHVTVSLDPAGAYGVEYELRWVEGVYVPVPRQVTAPLRQSERVEGGRGRYALTDSLAIHRAKALVA
jgi:hypothetical protein